jgi:hypothetical protein
VLLGREHRDRCARLLTRIRLLPGGDCRTDDEADRRSDDHYHERNALSHNTLRV